MPFCCGWKGHPLSAKFLGFDDFNQTVHVHADLMMFHFYDNHIMFQGRVVVSQSVSKVCCFFNDQLARWF